jgi:hypothetical protein
MTRGVNNIPRTVFTDIFLVTVSGADYLALIFCITGNFYSSILFFVGPAGTIIIAGKQRERQGKHTAK